MTNQNKKEWLCPCGNKAEDFDFCSQKCDEEYSVKAPIISDWEYEQYRFTEKLLNDFKNKRIGYTDFIDAHKFFIQKVRDDALEEIRDKIENILLANTDIPEYTDAKAMEDLGKLYKELDEKLK